MAAHIFFKNYLGMLITRSGILIVTESKLSLLAT